MKHLFYIIIVSWALTGCESEPESFVKEYTVNHHLRPAQGFIPVMSLMVRSGDVSTWNNLFQSIEGFEFDWGYEYQLAVFVTEIDNPPADGSSLRFQLLEEISKTKVPDGTTFEIQLKRASSETNYVTDGTGEGPTLLGRIAVDCEDLCTDLENLLSTDQDVFGVFEHVDNEKIRLIQVRAN